MIGRTLGHYQVVEKIGQGGMGVVYKARDSHLDRFVAIKVLPPERIADDARKARFVQEAKAASALNHPNIIHIYDISSDSGHDFMAMEYVAGKTLDQFIPRKGLRLSEALNIAVQIADALTRAHAAGIVHRDLKPANVMVDEHGLVKVLDFGLAKLLEKGDLEEAETVAMGVQTEEGAIVGTVAYMSPEQAEGKKVDARADIFSFGAVLYEMVTGQRAFQGDSRISTLSAVLHKEPPPLAGDVQYDLTKVLTRCLRKNPDRRFQHMDDIKIALDDLRAEPDPAEPGGGANPPIAAMPHRRWLLIGIPAVVALVMFAAGVLVDRILRSAQPLPVIRSSIPLPAGTQLARETLGPTRTEIAISPDSGYLVFSATTDGSEAKSMLYRRPLDRTEASVIPNTEGARIPFFSPDGSWIGFWAKQKLYKVPSAGGIPTVLCTLPEPPMGASWGLDGRIILGTAVQGLQQVPGEGGNPEIITKIDSEKEAGHRMPRELPGGKAMIFTAAPYSLGATARIELLRPLTGERKILIEDGADARYAPTGHLVFVRRGTLMALPFDVNRLEVTGSAVPVVDSIMQAFNEPSRGGNSAAGQYAFSESGSLAYASGGIFPDPKFQWHWVDRKGLAEPIEFFSKKPVSGMAISPDGKEIGYVSAGMEANLWVYDIARGTSTKLTQDGRALFPVWAPDGSRMTFSWTRAGIVNIWSKAARDSGAMEQVNKSEFRQFPHSWTRDGKFLALVEDNPTSGTDILISGMGDKQLRPYLCTRYNEGSPKFSPDGRWIAYQSNESGKAEVYIRSFPAGDKVIPISNQGGVSPLWAPDGHELFYWNPGQTRLMKVDIVPGQELSPGMPKLLFEFTANTNYDITPDGKRFLISKRLGFTPNEVKQLNFVHNWFEELKRLAPAGKN